MAKKNKTKKAKIATTPTPQKTAKITNPPPHFAGGLIAWRFNAADKNGPFSWALLFDDPKLCCFVLEKLAHLETLNEAQLENCGCHFIDVNLLSQDATNRLEQLKLDDIDQLYSFRLNGKCRVFAIHRVNYMRILWLDPNHLVCPSKLKHT